MNLFVIPLAFGIVSGSVITIVLFLLFGSDFNLANFLDFLLTVLNKSIVFITEIPGAMSEGIWLNNFSIFFFVATIVSFIVFMYFKVLRALVLMLSFIVGMQITGLLSSYKGLQKKQITFYALKNPTWSVVDGKQAEIYSLAGEKSMMRK